jgi:uncharacterized protein involved in exopolysaccharide biosynthesis
MRALDVLIFLARHRRVLVVAPLATALAAAAISLALPNMYAGVTKILPPQQNQSSAVLMLAQLGTMANLPASSLGIKNPNDLYVGMLKSRTVADSLVGRFGLKELYGRDTLQDTRRELEERTAISHGRDGIITIRVEDRERKRAADLANGYVEELYNLTQTLAVTEAGHRRLFLEGQLKSTRQGLADAEMALKKTQETTGLIKLDEQGKAIIEAVANLRAQIAAKEVELGAMRLFATERNPGYLRVQQEIGGLRSELARLEKSNRSGGSGDIFVPTGRVPEAGLEYLRRLRDVKYYESVFELLAKQYEIAKIDEARDASIVQVLDRAVEPEKKSSPHRARIVIVSALLAFLAALLWALVREANERARQDPEHSRRLNALRELLRLKRI